MALGLGDIHLNPPWMLRSMPISTWSERRADELSGLKATLASRDTFSSYGLEYPAFLAAVTLEPRQPPTAATVLHMHSSEAVNEPFADPAGGGQLGARTSGARIHGTAGSAGIFTATAQSSSAAAVAAPVTGEAARSGSVERRAAAPTTGNSPRSGRCRQRTGPRLRRWLGRVVRPAPAATRCARRYAVRDRRQVYGPGDRSARQRGTGGVYRANTSAFDGNMNILRSGSRLQLPGESELMAISPGEAAAEVHRQYSAWNAGARRRGRRRSLRGAGQLRLVPPARNRRAAEQACVGRDAASPLTARQRRCCRQRPGINARCSSV